MKRLTLLIGLLVIGVCTTLMAQTAFVDTNPSGSAWGFKNNTAPGCDSVPVFTVKSDKSCELNITASSPVTPNNSSSYTYVITILQGTVQVEQFLKYALPINITKVKRGGLAYQVKIQAFCCDNTNDCGNFPDNNWLAAPIQTRSIVAKLPSKGTMGTINQTAKTYNSAALNWTFTPSDSNSNTCKFSRIRYRAVVKYNGSTVKTDVFENQNTAPVRYFTGLEACKNYDITITAEEGVFDYSGNYIWFSGMSKTINNVETKCCSGLGNITIGNITPSNFRVSWQSYTFASAENYRVDILLNNIIVQTAYKKPTSWQIHTLFLDFNNLIQATNYKVRVTALCECTPTTDPNAQAGTSICITNGNFAEVPAVTTGDPCTTPSTLNIVEKTSNTIKVAWVHNPYASNKRYQLRLKDMQGNELQAKTIDAPYNAAATLDATFSVLSAATNYNISIYAECCNLSNCTIYNTGSITSVIAKTNTITNNSCTTTPTTFSFSDITATSVTMQWIGQNNTALSSTGRRFLVNVINGPNMLVSNGTNSIIGGLTPNTTYQVKVQEVFDGVGTNFTVCCNELSYTVKTASIANLCDSTFNATVFCASQNYIMLDFTVGNLAKYPNLSAKVRYKNVTNLVWQNNPASANIDGCTKNGIMGTGVPSPIPFMYPSTAIPWQEQVVYPGNNKKCIITQLDPCNFYEIEVDLIATQNAYQYICKTVNFPTFYKTSASDEPTIDDDNDGILDQCDDNVAVPNANPNLATLLCQAFSAPPLVSQNNLLTKLDTGAVIKIAKFPIKVTKVTPQNTLNPSGIYSGEGIVSLPFSGTKLKVAFTNIAINSIKEVFAGTVEGIKDNPANYTSVQALIQNTNSLNTNATFCNKNPQNDEFDSNGIHKGTGLPWDENGFGPDGQYIKNPPYEGYLTGDPYDPNYNPQGFDANGKHKNGTLYNEFGCDSNGKKANGSDCDTIPPPYYWTNTNGSAGGIALAGAVADSLKPWIQLGLQKSMQENNANLAAQKQKCDLLRSAIRLHNTALNHDSLFTFGENSKWINVGMHKYFASEPEILKINTKRDDHQELLENKHKELYYCDVDEYKFADFKNIILQLGTNIDVLVAEFKARIKNLPKSETDKLMPNGTLDKGAFKLWLNKKLYDKIEYEYKLKNKTTDVEPSEESSTTAIAATNYNPKMEYTKQESALFDFEQGKEYINGVHRAFYIEAIAKERAMMNMVSSPVNGVEVLPFIISKTVMGKETDIFIDEIKITPSGGSLDAYFILNPTPAKDRLVFKAGSLQFAHTGFPSAVKMSLATNKTIPWDNILRFTLKGSKDTYVSFDCDGFNGLGIDAEFEFCRKYIKPLDPNTLEIIADETKMVKATVKATMPVWSEFVAEANVSPFAITGIEDVKWQIDSAVLDLSDEITPAYVKFPSNYNVGVSNNQWRGFYLKKLACTLPKTFASVQGQPVTIAAKDIIIDRGGVSGQVAVAPLFPLKDGNAGGWAFSIDTFNLGVLRNKPVASWFNGYIHIPILDDKDTLQYRAAILKDGIYQFAIKPKTDVDFKSWFAKGILSPSTTVAMEYKNKQFYVEANLSGKMSILSNKVKGLDTISFENVVLCNQAPYFKSAGAFGKSKNKKSQLLGFGINLHSIGLVKDSSGAVDIAKINFGLDLNLTKDTSLDITAGGAFQIKCALKTTKGRQRWIPQSFDIKELKVGGSFGPVEKLAGIITFFDETTPGNTLYGTGFRGAVDFKIKGLGQVRALALFGKKSIPNQDGYRYFFVDAMATFAKGVPIFTGVDLLGIGGGVYYHMGRDTLGYKGFAATPPSVLTLPVGSSLSGIKYVPDDNKGIGLKLSVIIASQGNKTAFNANATFEILFNSQKGGGGLSDMWLYGVAKFMSEPDTSKSPGFKPGGVAPPTKYANTISGYVDLHYDFNAKEFNGLIKAYANIGNGTIKGGYGNNLVGAIEMRFAPNTWYVNIGRPEKDKRIKLIVAIPGTTAGLNLSAYLDIGKSIPAMPPLPNNVTSLLGQSNFLSSESQRASGKGFAFGASIDFNIPRKDCCFGKKLFFGDFQAGAGFDIMMQNYGKTTTCTNTGKAIGIEGWYAAGQMYAYLQGKIGIYALGKEIDILEIGAAALLQAKMPNPFYAKGIIGGKYKVAGGLVKGECRFQFEVGESCAISGSGTPPLDALIVDINPLNNDSLVNVTEKPNAQFSVPVGQDFNSDNKVHRVEISQVFVKNVATQDIVDGTYRIKEGSTDIDFEPSEMLPANTVLKFEVSVREYENNAFKREETKNVTFRTNEPLAYIPTENISASYPTDAMYNFYTKETSNGYVELKNGQALLLKNTADHKSLVIFKSEIQTVIGESTFTYDEATRKISFPLPNLPKGKVLLMEIVNQYTEVGRNQPPTNKTLLSITFRTSIYDKFMDKINLLKTAMTNDPSVAGTKILQFNTNLPEPFDKAEIEGFSGQQPLIEFVSQSTDWLKLQVQPFLYDNLPVTIGKNNINLTWKTVEENGTKPVAPDAGLQFIQPNKNVVLQVAPNQLGQMPTLNPSQKLRFDLYQIVEDDYKMVVPQLKSALNERYNWYISDTYCGGLAPSQCNDPEDCKFCAKKGKTKYNLNSDISAYNFANSALGDALMTVVNSSTYPQPPAAQSTDVNITYRLPGKGGVSTLTSITLGGTGNKPSAGDTKGKSGYVPTQDASRSGNDALKILDFLKLDDKVLNYSDLQTEADDLYAKHGFRTYVVPRLPTLYNLSALGMAEYKKDVDKRIKILNTDGKPYIVIDLDLQKDLDFKGDIIASNWIGYTGGGSAFSDDFKKQIITYTTYSLGLEKNHKLDVEEPNNSLTTFNRLLNKSGGTPDVCNFPASLNLALVKSMTITDKYYNIIYGNLYQLHERFGLYYRATKNELATSIWQLRKDGWKDKELYFKHCENSFFNPYALHGSLLNQRNNIESWLSLGVPSGTYQVEYNSFHSKLKDFYTFIDNDLKEASLFQNKFNNVFNNRVSLVLIEVNKKGKEAFGENWCDLTLAEVKAKSATETSDFTNTDIKGADANESIYKQNLKLTSRLNLGSFRTDEKDWEEAKKFIEIEVFTKNNPKFNKFTKSGNEILEVADDCLPLVAAYFGVIINQIKGKVPTDMKGVDLKVALLGAYLTGATGMSNILYKCKGNYTWTNITSHYTGAAKGQEADLLNVLWRLGYCDPSENNCISQQLDKSKKNVERNKCKYDNDYKFY